MHPTPLLRCLKKELPDHEPYSPTLTLTFPCTLSNTNTRTKTITNMASRKARARWGLPGGVTQEIRRQPSDAAARINRGSKS